ncbi:MAG TPA: hypothetical protein VK900_12720 [Anaerolineales bacterium]|nr:hypothetical protein [Anaerolineales bacterium]
MKRVLLTLLGLVVVIGLFSAVGYAGYRLGLAQGVERRADGDPPRLRPFAEFGPRALRMHDFEFRGGFARGFGGFPGLGFFFLFRLLFWMAALVLVVWLISWLLARSGWRLVRETSTPPAPPRPENE